MKLTKLKIQNILFLFWTFLGFAGEPANRSVPVDKIRFHGLNQISSQEVSKWFGLREKSAFSLTVLNQGCQKLLKGYAESGMPYTKIDSVLYKSKPDSSGIEIDVFLNEGHELKIGQIELSGLDSVQLVLLKSRFESQTGHKLQVDKIEQDIDDALLQMERLGYPFSRFDLKGLQACAQRDAEQINFKWAVASGPQLHIKDIQVAGNTLTKKNVIIREIRIPPGTVYDQKKVSRIQERLMKLGFFKRVAKPQVFWIEKNNGGIFIEVEEGKSSIFDGVIGYNPGTEDNKGYFTGLVDISLGNLFGTGRMLQAHMQKRDQNSQDLKFYYKEPWIAGFPVTVGGGFEQLIQDSTYVQRDITMDIAMPISENFSLHGQIAHDEITPDSLGSFSLGIPRSRTIRLAIGLNYDTRDDLINPHRGVFYQTTVESGSKKNLGPQLLIEQLQLKTDVANKRITMDVEFYMPLFKRDVFALTLHGRQIQSNEKYIPLSDQFRMGGTKTLRGYREFQFRGSRVAWSNCEFRYLIGRRSRVFVFLDTGYYEFEQESGKNSAYKYGYGLGFRLETGLGIMGIDYGLGEDKGLFNGKIHVGLINVF